MTAMVAPRSRHGWQPMTLGIAIMVLATLWIYRDTAQGLVDLWGQSETFAHGYAVPFIALWLIWRQRKAITEIGRAHV